MTPSITHRRKRCDHTTAWAALHGHFEAHGRDLDLREAFARDAGRFAAMSFEAPEVFADLSKNLLDTATLRFLVDAAGQRSARAQRSETLLAILAQLEARDRRGAV